MQEIRRCQDSSSPVNGKQKAKATWVSSHVAILNGQSRNIRLC